MNERTVTEEQVQEEHLAEVSAAAHWAYLIGVLVVGFLLMVGLIAILGATGGG